MVLTMQNRLAALVINITTRKGSDSHQSGSPQMGVAPDDVYSEYVSFKIFSLCFGRLRNPPTSCVKWTLARGAGTTAEVRSDFYEFNLEVSIL